MFLAKKIQSKLKLFTFMKIKVNISLKSIFKIVLKRLVINIYIYITLSFFPQIKGPHNSKVRAFGSSEIKF